MLWKQKDRGGYILEKRLYSLIQLMSPIEQKELYMLLKQMMLRRAEKDSWNMTSDLMRRFMKKEKL